MQEGTVGWDPISIRPVFSWQEKVFVLYCLFVVGFAVLRSISLARHLWFGGALAEGKGPGHSQFRFVWEICSSRVVRMRRLAVFTILITLLVFADGVANFLATVTTEKQIGMAAAAGTGAQLAAFVGFGLIVCALLYACAALFEGVLFRRMAHWNLSGEAQTVR